MEEYEEDSRYSLTIRHKTGKRQNILFENREEIYEYCQKMNDNDDINGSDYEILDVVKYQKLWDHIFAIPLYSAIESYKGSLLWDDLLHYII